MTFFELCEKYKNIYEIMLTKYLSWCILITVTVTIIKNEVNELAGIKYSKQREAILTYLHSTKEHPTAEVVYTKLRETNPKLSLGTVYRNLNLLADSGEILRLNCGDGTDHFDATTEPHYHFRCEKCGKVLDLDMPSIDHIDEVAAERFDGEVHGHEVYFYGICKKCL